MNSTQSSAELLEAYIRADGSARLRYVRISIVLFLFLMPTFSGLDAIVYPQHFESMLRIRMAFDGVFILLLILTFTPIAGQIRAFGVVSAVLAGCSISWMVVVSEGATSPYYAGLNLILVVMSVLLPWTLMETAIVCVATTMIYVIACFVHTPELLENRASVSVLSNNLFFLGATSVICMTASYFQSVRRFEEFRLRFELNLQNEKLSNLDRQKSEFFANISHELRTPLTLILAPVQEVLQSGHRLPDALGERLGIVRDNGLRLLKLVNDLLDIIRLEEGKEKLELVPVDVNAVLGGSVDSMTYLADTKGISLSKRLSAGPLVVKGDVRALEKVFVNLLSNAIKFTEGGGSIVAETSVDNNLAIVRITDTGIGIPQSELPRIFDRFHQVDGSSTRRYRGTGLGLALVKEMVECLGGVVAAESMVGRGATMILRIPLAERDDASSELKDAGEWNRVEGDRLEDMHRLAERAGGITVEAPPPILDDSPDDDNRGSLLIVEDEPDMRRYLTDLLRVEYRVFQARTGSEGLRLALESDPDLILLDLMLPEMDGLEVCRRIREHDPARRQKIMLLTARVDEHAKLTALEHGADDFLTKPFSSVEVKTRLRNLLASAILERDLADRNRRLQQTLAELEATQAQLVQSEKLNALGSLAAGLLHEINNPLNYSLTALQLLRSDPSLSENELLSEMLGDIDEGMQRIRAIVSDLRAFAYPTEAEKRMPFDFAAALESALRFTSHEVKGIDVVKCLPESARVLGSRSHITQVLVNLLSNAAKAIAPVSSERTGRIQVNASLRGDRLQVRVVDNGVGMDGDTLNRIFEPFFTTRDVGEGMGLGLSISHTIVGNHGGRLLAQSRLGEGTEMAFDLPLAA